MNLRCACFASIAASLALLASTATADDLSKTPERPGALPAHVSTDPTVKIDYDIVYVRAPRFVRDAKGKDVPAEVWPSVAHPYNLCAPTDLMILHPDGSEEVLLAGGKGAIADPNVSFDAQWVYYTGFHDPTRNGEDGSGGADVFKIHVKTRKTIRLTQPQFTPNTGVADWSSDFRTPQKGKVHLTHAVCNMQPCPLPGGRVVFVSNRDAVRTPRGPVRESLQLYVMDDDGSNVEKIGYLNVAGALHPSVLEDGRIMFDSFEAMGMRGYGGPYSAAAGFWGLWTIHPDGTNWEPLVSAYRQPPAPKTASHFQTQLSDGSVVVNNYYGLAKTGFGTYLKLPPRPADGEPGFDPAKPTQTTPGEIYWRFKPAASEYLTPFAAGIALNDGKHDTGLVTQPCGAPDNHLLTVWASNKGIPSPAAPLGPIDSGIYLIKNGRPALEPGAMLLVKNDPKFNEQWPRPLVPYKRIHGIDEPRLLPRLKNDGKLSPHLPEGTPFGLVGASSLYKRETFPDGQVPPGSVTATGDPYTAFPRGPKSPSQNGKSPPWGWGNILGRINWQHQGSDAGLYSNSDIHAIRIVALEPATMPVAQKFVSRAGERFRILGEIPVRHFADREKTDQPLDPDGNPDTSFLARIPADVAWTFQTLDKDGMVLNMAQTWHQLRPGEVRTDCGGCHAHSQKPTLFKDTAAARADYPIFDLTKSTPLLTEKTNDQSGKRWDAKDQTGLRFAKGVLNVEYCRDIKPIFERSCVACHTSKSGKPAGNLVLDDDRLVETKNLAPLPATYVTLNKNLDANEDAPKEKVYIWHFRSRNSPLVWSVFGRRMDGFPEKPLPVPNGAASHKRVLELEGNFKVTLMPPPDAVAGTYEGPDGKKIRVAPLTDEDRRTLVRWIDLGCPIDRDYDPRSPEKLGHGWMLDDQRPTLTVTYPLQGRNESLSRILIGMYDNGTGLDLKTLSVVADFPIDGIAAGENLATRFKELADSRWELRTARPISTPLRGKLTVSVKDRQGNVCRVERTLSIGESER